MLFLVILYILLSPISMILPPVPFGNIDLNLYRIPIISLCVISLIWILFRRWILPKKYLMVVIVACFFYCLTFLVHWEDGLIEQINGSFSLLTFLIILFVFMMVHKEHPFKLWTTFMVLSSCIAFLFALSIYLRVMPIPSYRYVVERLFYESRTASVIDSHTGIWGMISAIYLIATEKRWRWIILGYFGLIMSTGLIILGGFRTELFIAMLIILSCFFIPSLKNIKKHYLILITVLFPFFILLGSQLISIEGVRRYRELITGKIGSDTPFYLRKIENQIEIRLIIEKPFLGHGWAVTNKYFISIPGGGTNPIYGHCLYTAIPVRVGIPIFIIIMSIFFLSIIRGWRLLSLDLNPTKKIEITLALFGIIAFLINSITINGLLIGTTSGFVAIYIAHIFRVKPYNFILVQTKTENNH